MEPPYVLPASATSEAAAGAVTGRAAAAEATPLRVLVITPTEGERLQGPEGPVTKVREVPAVGRALEAMERRVRAPEALVLEVAEHGTKNRLSQVPGFPMGT